MTGESSPTGPIDRTQAPAEGRPLQVRELRNEDERAVARILASSEYVHVRLEPGELGEALRALPAVGAFSRPPGPLGRTLGGTLQGFLLVNWLAPPSAWIGAFGVTWSEGTHFERYLDLLLPEADQRARARGGRMLYYSGSDLAADWLRGPLTTRGFSLVARLRSYDKSDFAVAAEGNQLVTVRAFTPADLPAVVEVEKAAFAEPWRHDATSFSAIAARYPYFVVAEDALGVCGYQFNTLDGPVGYLVRIAVHPRVAGSGVGTRLMAEAIRYFQRAGVRGIALNTEEANIRAHALYERFGFYRVYPEGFVLGRAIPTP